MLLALIAFLKDLTLATYFGTSEVADALNFAFFIPDMIGNNLIGAAIAVSAIPVFTKLASINDQFLLKMTFQKLGFGIIVGTSVLLIILLVLLKPLIHLLSFKSNIDAASVYLFLCVLSPVVMLSPLWLLGSSVLQASKRFILSAFTPVLLNALLLLTLVVIEWQGVAQPNGAKIFALSVVLSTCTCTVITWWHLFKEQGWTWKWTVSTWIGLTNEVKDVINIFVAYILILVIIQVGLLAERLFASVLDTGTIAALSYAYRLSQFPLWVFIAAITTFLLPTISLHVERNERIALKKVLVQSLSFVIVCSVVISSVFFLFTEPIVKLLFLRGAFTEESVRLTSAILKGYGLSIVGQSLFVFCTRYYVASRTMKKPIVVALIGGSINLVALYFLVPVLGAAGIGYAIALASSISGGCLLFLFLKEIFKKNDVGGELI